MAVVIGTNAGFVNASPIADPASGTKLVVDNTARAIKDTSPAGSNLIVTEIGWWCDDATEEANYEVAIYDHDAGNNRPGNIVGSDIVNAKGLGAGWKKVTGLNISINAITDYWVALQLDNTPSSTSIDIATSGGTTCFKSGQTALTDPWGATNSSSFIYALYAVVEEGEEGTNIQINIGDVWKDVAAMQINIGDVWKDVAAVKQNIGDVWKDVF